MANKGNAYNADVLTAVEHKLKQEVATAEQTLLAAELLLTALAYVKEGKRPYFQLRTDTFGLSSEIVWRAEQPANTEKTMYMECWHPIYAHVITQIEEIAVQWTKPISGDGE